MSQAPQGDHSEDPYEDYLKPLVGMTIVAVSEEDDSVFIHLNDGLVLEFYAEREGGFSAEIHQPGPVH